MQRFNTDTVLDKAALPNYQFGMISEMPNVPRKSKSASKPNFIAAHRIAVGLSQDEVAARLRKQFGLKTTQNQVSRLETGERGLSVDWLNRFAAVFGKSATDLMDEPRISVINDQEKLFNRPIATFESSPVVSPPNATPTNEGMRTTRRRIDILGHSAGGRDGRFLMNGESVGQIFCPPSVEAASSPYAVYVFGTSMSPRYDDGEMVVANPDLPYGKDHYVIVQLSTDEENVFDCYVKKFVSLNSKELVLEQLNPPRGHDAIMRFPAKRVRAIHKLVGFDGK